MPRPEDMATLVGAPLLLRDEVFSWTMGATAELLESMATGRAVPGWEGQRLELMGMLYAVPR